MESSSPSDATDTKAAFRKPSNDAANRKYRRRSPAKGSSSPEGSPNLNHISSPVNSGQPTKAFEHRSRKKDSERELEGDALRGQYDRDSDRHTDRQFSRSSHGYSRHNDYVRHDKRANDGERDGERYSERTSSRSGRESRTSDYARREIDHGRSKEHLSSGDKSNRDRYDISGHRSRDMEKVSSYQENPSSERAGSGRRHKSSNLEQMDRDWHKRGRDEKRDYHQSSRDSKNDRFLTYEESRIERNKSSREGGGHRMREADKREPKEHDKQEKKKYNDWEPDRDRDHYKVKVDFASENQDKPIKKSKFSNWDKGGDYAKDDSEKSSSSKQAPEAGGNVAQAHANANDSEVANNLDAAKVAAMRAAELVNKNLVGVGYMSADQKKKLLWGNKKSTVTEESGNRWDTALIGDRDRQEKFQKLMSLRLPWYIWPIVGCEGRAERGTETQQSRSSREATGTPARFGEAVHSWTSTERWSHCRIGSLNDINCGSLFCEFLFYSSCAGIWVLFLYFCYVRQHVFFCWGYQILEKEKCHSDMVVFQYLSGFAGLFLFK